MHRPASSEYAPAHAAYVDLVSEDDIVSVLEEQLGAVEALLGPLPEEEGNVRHAPYTWSIKDVVGHLIDCERVFGYRTLRFARGDATPLAGFDENLYAPAAESDRCRLGELLAEFESLRRSHIWFFQHLPEAAWTRTGVANGNTVSVRALAYIMAGHVRHHLAILRRRLSAPA
jgi:DinB superfamily